MTEDGEGIIPDEILTVAEVAEELRCSKAHVHNCINGRVAGVSPLPAIHMGRRELIRRSALERWKRLNEKGANDVMMGKPPEVDAVRPMGGETRES
jgi:excisionase family DNA binding protein